METEMATLGGIRHFRETEFRHLDLVNQEALFFLDEVRTLYGKPLILTDDARTPDERPSGYSPTSLHYKGRAFDLRWNFMPADVFRLVSAAMKAARDRPAEIELVKGVSDRHVHLGLFDDPAHPSTLVIATD